MMGDGRGLLATQVHTYHLPIHAINTHRVRVDVVVVVGVVIVCYWLHSLVRDGTDGNTSKLMATFFI